MRKKQFRWIALLLAVLMLFSLSGCSTQKALSDDTVKTLKQSIIDEFTAFCKVPRPSGHTEKALAYLTNWTQEKGFAYQTDDAGNIWWDVPATAGYENVPKILLQGHMDMVCVAEEGKTVDFENTGITPIVTETTITADGTSLGANGGIGVATMMAISTSSAPHGPLRMIVTRDEETTMTGAKGLSVDTLDADYLINLDYEDNGRLCYSSGGAAGYVLSKTCQTVSAENSDTLLTVKLSGLLGGHSGVMVNQGHLSAVKGLSAILKKLEDAELAPRLSDFSCGQAQNTIANAGQISFAVSADKIDEAKSIINETIDALKKEYPVETGLQSEITTANVTEISTTSICSTEDSKTIIGLLEDLPQDVITLSSKTKNFPQTSNNIAIVQLKNGEISVSTFLRSCANDELQAKKKDFETLAVQYGFNHEFIGEMPGYDGNPDTGLEKLLIKGYQTAGVKAVSEATHAGLELGYLDAKKPGITMISLGPTLNDVHTPDETVELETIEPMLQALYYCFQHTDEL